jgi:hypothetical protein
MATSNMFLPLKKEKQNVNLFCECVGVILKKESLFKTSWILLDDLMSN